MRAYLAGKFTAKERLKEVRKQLRDMGVGVTSQWLDMEYANNVEADTIMVEEGVKDIQEVLGAKLFFIDTIDESATGGRECEMGIFLGKGRTTTEALRHVYLVGPKRQIFHWLIPELNQFASWEDFFARHTIL